MQEYLGIVTGATIVGANVLKDLGAPFRDVFGGPAGAWEGERIGSGGVGGSGNMLMVTAAGTAVRL